MTTTSNASPGETDSLMPSCVNALKLAGLIVLGIVVAALPPSRTHAEDKSSSPNYAVVKTVPIPGDDGWDYVAVDSEARRVYVSHGTHVVVVDADSYTIVGDIPNTPGVHGIAVAPDLNRGFISNGRGNSVTIFDLKTLAKVSDVPTGQNPDAIVYDDVTKRVFAMDGRSSESTAIDAASGKVLATIPVGGKPEFAVADGTGAIYVNIEDKSELLRLDARKLTATNRWPMAPCQEPSGLAIDVKNRRLFAGCNNRIMGIIDADSGKVIATAPIGDGVDAIGFDPATQLAFASNGEGTLTVVHEENPSHFTVIQSLPTQRSARTLGLDLHTHTIFLPAADLLPPTPSHPHGTPKPSSFVLLIAAPQPTSR